VPVGFLSNRHDKPGATGENACTREQRSGGPVTARSGGTTDAIRRVSLSEEQTGIVTTDLDRWQDIKHAGPQQPASRGGASVWPQWRQSSNAFLTCTSKTRFHATSTPRKEGLIAEKTRLTEEMAETEWKIVAEIADCPKWSRLLLDIRTWFEKQYRVGR
jgi:hypothetical protein